MTEKEMSSELLEFFHRQWMGQHAPPAVLLEQRVWELERLGLSDTEEVPGVPSSLRQYATASLLRAKPAFYVTHDNQLLLHRELLAIRYGLEILSLDEAVLLLNEDNGPPN